MNEPAGGGIDRRPEDLERAVVHAAAVLERLAEAQAAPRPRRNRAAMLVMGLLLLGSIGSSFLVLAWIVGGGLGGRESRADELMRLTGAFRDALADRAKYEEKVASLESRAARLEKDLADQKSAGSEAASELDRTRADLQAARKKVFEYDNRAIDEKKGIDKMLELIAAKRGFGGANPNDSGAASHPSLAAGDGDTNIPVSLAGPDALHPAAARAPKPLPPSAVKELNLLLAYSTQTSLSLIEAAGTVGHELRDAFFTKYGPQGKPAGFVSAARVTFEESRIEPRLRMRLLDGFDIVGKTRTPFVSRDVDFRSVDPSDWKRRIPEIFAGASGAAESKPAEPAPRNPQFDAVIGRLNKIFAAHTDYLRLRIDDVVSIEPGGFYGIGLVTLVVDRDATAPRVDETVRAERMSLTLRVAERRLEIDLDDGTRGRGRPVPFPGGKLHYFIPGVALSELEGGDPAIPFQKR